MQQRRAASWIPLLLELLLLQLLLCLFIASLYSFLLLPGFDNSQAFFIFLLLHHPVNGALYEDSFVDGLEVVVPHLVTLVLQWPFCNAHHLANVEPCLTQLCIMHACEGILQLP
jgi:hypothetical protein